MRISPGTDLLQAVAAAPRRAAVSDYMRRFCSQLGIKRREVNACTEVADNAVPREGTTRYNTHLAELLCIRTVMSGCENAQIVLLNHQDLEHFLARANTKAATATPVACR